MPDGAEQEMWLGFDPQKTRAFCSFRSCQVIRAKSVKYPLRPYRWSLEKRVRE